MDPMIEISEEIFGQNFGDILHSQYLLHDQELFDLSLHGRGFTWANGQSDPI